MTIDVETKLMEAFAAQNADGRQRDVISARIARRAGEIDAWLAVFADQNEGESFQDAVNKRPDLAKRFREMAGGPQ